MKLAGLLLAALLAALLAGCAPLPVPRAMPAIEVIRFEVQPGFMAGRGYEIVVASTGEGRLKFEFSDHGRWWTTYRRLHVTNDQFAAFRARLGKYRPIGQLDLASPQTCPQEYDDDSDRLRIEWSGGTAPPAGLTFSYGCDAGTQRARTQDLGHAYESLGIDPERLVARARGSD